MPSELQLVAVGLVLTGAAYKLGARTYKSHYHHTILRYVKLQEAHTALFEQAVYLVHMLEENHVEIDEFDRIVLTQLHVIPET